MGSEGDTAGGHAAALARLDAVQEGDADGLTEAQLAAFWRVAKPFFAAPPAALSLLRGEPPGE